MRLASPEKIKLYRDAGWWGNDTLYDLFVRGVKARGGALAAADPSDRMDFLGDTPRRLTWIGLESEVEHFARMFTDYGLVRGDRLLTQLPNVIEGLGVYLACAKLGIIISPVPVQYQAFELDKIIDSIRPSGYVITSRFKDRDIEKYYKGAGEGQPVFTAGPKSIHREFVDLSEGNVSMPERLKGAQVCGSGFRHSVDADDCFSITWTSGTTGTPKGVPRSHNHWLSVAPVTYDAMSIQEHDILLNPFPMTNMAAIGGMFVSWLISQGTLILHHPFDVALFLGQLASENVDATIAAPAVLTAILKNPNFFKEFDLSSLRVVGSGSAPLSEYMVKGWQERGVEIVNLFGSNEGVSLATGPEESRDPAQRATRFPRFGYEHASFSNRMHLSMKTKIVSQDGERVIDTPGTVGELLVMGPAVFEGYWGESAQEHASLFDQDGFFRTGDLFMVDPVDEKFIYFYGRSKDIIIRGGINISAVELDMLLSEYPKVLEAAVFGISDDIMGERVGVAVVPVPGETVDLQSVKKFLESKQIAIYKLPEHCINVDEIPRNAMGKVVRSTLKMMADEHTL